MKVELLDSDGNVVATTYTAGDGSFSFTGVEPGSYTLRETDPNGYVSTTPNDVAISIPSNGAATVIFGDRPEGSISGNVFNDLNGDGVQQPGESGIGGVTVKLLDSNGTVVATTTTAADGSYVFTNVTAGLYSIQETDPSGYVSTTPNLVPISLPPGGAASASFGDQKKGTISGAVFNDVNGDGVQGPGEGGLAGILVTLRDGNGNVVATTTTAADGTYVFANVPAGSYSVEETDPSGFTSSTPNTVNVTVGGTSPAVVNFGDQQKQSVSGRVFNDLNGDGVQQPGENGLGGVIVELLDDEGNSVGTALTALDGSYRFTGVGAGVYTMQQALPSGFTNTTPTTVPVTVPPGGAASAAFGDRRQGTISGRVFDDVNADGTQNGAEKGIGGVTVTLLDAQGGVVAQVVTAADGSYSFTVPPGNYTVVQSNLPGYSSTTPDSVPVSLGSAEDSASVNFGDNLPPDLALEKTGPPVLEVGTITQYVLTVRNVGNGMTRGPITVTDPLPSGFVFKSFSGQGWSCTASAEQVVTCTSEAPMYPNDPPRSVALTVAVTQRLGSGVTNKASVSVQGDPSEGNNSGELYSRFYVPAPVPAMDEVGLILLVLSLLGFAGYGLRDRSSERTR